METITEYVKLGREIDGIHDSKYDVLEDKKRQIKLSILNDVEKIFLSSFIDAKTNYNAIKNHEKEYTKEYLIVTNTLSAYRNHFYENLNN